MKAFKKTIKSKDIYREYVNILNSQLHLSCKEKELLSLLLEIELTKVSILGTKRDLLSTDNRKALMNKAGVNKNNLSKYLSILREKRIILRDNDGHYLNSMFIPDMKDNTSETMFILNLEEDEDNKL